MIPVVRFCVNNHVVLKRTLALRELQLDIMGFDPRVFCNRDNVHDLADLEPARLQFFVDVPLSSLNSHFASLLFYGLRNLHGRFCDQ